MLKQRHLTMWGVLFVIKTSDGLPKIVDICCLIQDKIQLSVNLI